MSTFLSNNIKPRRGDTVTFTNNVSIGGTVTYEDVTNVDSVGIITSQSGIKVGAGQSISPVSGTITYYGDGSNLDGIEFGVENFVASGTIPNGKIVIIKDDGTVGIVTQTTSNTPSAGNPVVFNSDTSQEQVAAYDANANRVVIAYTNIVSGTYYGNAVVGTVDPSDNSITFGTPVEFDTNGNMSEYAIAYDSANQKVVIAYMRSDSGTFTNRAIVGTVNPSDNSITFGSSNSLVTGAISGNTIVYIGSSKVVISYTDPSNQGMSRVGSITGTTISFPSSSVAYNTSNTSYNVSVYDANADRVVIAYRDDGNNGHATARVGSISGTTISFPSSSVSIESSGLGAWNIGATYDSTNQKVVVSYLAGSNSSVKVGTVDAANDTISFPSPEVDFNYGSTNFNVLTYDSTNQKVVIAYIDTNNSSYGTARVGTVVGTGITFGEELVFSGTNSINYPAITYDSTNEKVVIPYKDTGSTNYGTAVVFGVTSQSTNLTSENYIGIAGESIANGATGKISVLGGVNSGQSGLTTAKKYYVAPTGILTTTADTPSVVAGTSISDSEILVWSS